MRSSGPRPHDNWLPALCTHAWINARTCICFLVRSRMRSLFHRMAIPTRIYQHIVDSTRAHSRPVPTGEVVQASTRCLTPWKLGWGDSHNHSSQVGVTLLRTPAKLPDRRSTESFRTVLPPVTDEGRVGKGISGKGESRGGLKHVAFACPRRHEIPTTCSWRPHRTTRHAPTRVAHI